MRSHTIVLEREDSLSIVCDSLLTLSFKIAETLCCGEYFGTTVPKTQHSYISYSSLLWIRWNSLKGTDKGGSVIPGRQVMISIQKTSGEILRQLHFWLSKARFRSNQVAFCGMRSWLRCPVSKLCCEHINVSRNTVGVNLFDTRAPDR